MSKWYCIQQSIFGDVKAVVEYPECERTRQLVERGIIKAHEEPEEAPKKRGRKGGKTAKSIDDQLEIK